MATDPGSKPLRFNGPVTVQFHEFLQSEMSTDAQGNQVFVGIVAGAFGTPPSRFEAQVKLTTGAKFTEDAYEVFIHPTLAQLGARPELRKAAFDYVNMCMSSMVTPNWARMTGLTAVNNVFTIPGAPVVIQFDDGSAAW